MLYYAGRNFMLFRSCFWAKDSPFLGWQTRKLSETNQQWSLWLYTKHVMDIFPSFWIRRPLTFGNYPIFYPTRSFWLIPLLLEMLHCLLFQGFKGHRFLTRMQNFLFHEFYLSLLFKFEIGSLLSLSCLMSFMFIIMRIIIRIIETTCLENTIVMAEREGKLP